MEQARQDKEYVTTEKQNLEKRLREQSTEDSKTNNLNCNLELAQLKEENEVNMILKESESITYLHRVDFVLY